MKQQEIASNPFGFIKQALEANDLMQCAECGVYTGIYVTVKDKHFCSDDCKELYFIGMAESDNADKYDANRDLDMESFNPDRY